MVRVDLDEPFCWPTAVPTTRQYVNEVDQAVTWITSLGMLAVLDLHLVNPADLAAPQNKCPPAANQIMADVPGSITFWSQLAARYAARSPCRLRPLQRAP